MDYRKLAASLAASLAACGAASTAAIAAPAPVSTVATMNSADGSRLANQYSGWAGSRSNADAIISGLRSGSSITIVTTGADRQVSLAGFSPPAAMSEGQISSALGNAQRSLSRLGIQRPNAEQIQAALIGGEVMLPNGRTAMIQGPVAVTGMQNNSGQVASR